MVESSLPHVPFVYERVLTLIGSNQFLLQGLALVTIAAQETAEQYVAGLRRNGLTSTLEPDTGCD